MKTLRFCLTLLLVLIVTTLACAADPVAVPVLTPAVAPAPSLIGWFTANNTAVFAALLAISELLSLIPAFKGNGILDTIIKGLQTLSGKDGQ